MSLKPPRFCPVCQQPGRLLAHCSSGAMVEYCAECGAVWSHDKGVTHSPAKPVTTAKRPGDLVSGR